MVLAWGGWNGVVVRVALGLAATQLLACGDDTGMTVGSGVTDGATSNNSTGMQSSTSSPSSPSSGTTEASAGTVTEGGATDSSQSGTTAVTSPTTGATEMTGASATTGTSDPSASTDPGMTGTTGTTGASGQTDTTMTSTGTSGGVIDTSGSSSGGMMCAMEKLCNDECCTAEQVCSEGQCQKDCGGPPPCGPQEDCCADGDLCYLGECVTPGAICDTQQCATKLANDCGPGKLCDAELKLCLPSKADLNCTYKPPAQTFKPVPTFTWGVRKVYACNVDADCQTAELCTKKVCVPTWPHLTIAANDKPTNNQSSSSAVVVDLDQDCVPEIVFNTYIAGNADTNGILRAIRGDNGAKVWTVTDPAFETNSTANPAVGDLDYDGKVEILVPAETKNILAFNSDGTPLWKSDLFTAANVSSAVAVANLDNDGYVV